MKYSTEPFYGRDGIISGDLGSCSVNKNEEDIIWLEDISVLDYVREVVITPRSRRRPFLRGLNGRVVGYSILRTDAPCFEEAFGLQNYLRRAWYLTSWDANGQPGGGYSDCEPCEAVDPNEVKVGQLTPHFIPKPVVYLIKCGDRCKIGMTTNFKKRISAFRYQLPYPVEVVHQIHTRNVREIENYWHKRFKDKKVYREWFELSDQDVEEFKTKNRM